MTSTATARATKRGADAGHRAPSPWQMPAKGWKQVAIRTWRESSDDNVGLVAAGVAFYGFLALVPLLAAIVLVYGLVAEPSTVVEHMQSLTAALPDQIARLIGEQLMNAVETSGGKKGIGLIVALAIALWGARNAAGAIITALNIANEEEEKRGFLMVTLIALAMTVASVVMALLAMAAMTALGYLHNLLPDTGPVALVAWKILSYALLAAVAAAAVATLYRYAPSRDKAKWTWITPGSLLASVAWVILTLGFGFYVGNFGNYDATYGSLGAVIVLVTWMYLSAYVLLFAAELNSELEHQTAKDTTAGAPEPLGTRGAWSADHVAGGAEPGAEEAGAAAISAPQPTLESYAPAIAVDRRPQSDGPSPAGAYAVSRATSRAGSVGGLANIGVLSSAIATAGLALMRQRGRGIAGAALLAAAGGLSLLKRKEA